MKKKILTAMLIMTIPVIFAGCGYTETAQQEQTNTANISSASVISDTETSDNDSAETAAVTPDSEITAEKNNQKSFTMTANNQKPKAYEPSATNPQAHEHTVTSQPFNPVGTDKPAEISTQKQTEPTAPTKPSDKLTPTETSPPVKPTETEFDINYWISFAQSYAKSVGLRLESSAIDCWDNPISANAKCKYLERDIKSRLNHYARAEDVTDVWIWAETVADNSYEIYIGYA